jgi:hypothetical protein
MKNRPFRHVLIVLLLGAALAQGQRDVLGIHSFWLSVVQGKIYSQSIGCLGSVFVLTGCDMYFCFRHFPQLPGRKLSGLLPAYRYFRTNNGLLASD